MRQLIPLLALGLLALSLQLLVEGLRAFGAAKGVTQVKEGDA